MLDIVFIILHYNVVEATINCVKSIVSNIDSDNYEIIIVDNYSPNKSFEYLNEFFVNDKKISIIQTSKNLGFANGNNFGIKYARKNYKFNYLCCCNNDIILNQKDFLYNLKKNTNDSSIGIIGPKVYTSDGKLQTYYCSLKSIDEYKKDLKKLLFYKKHYILYFIKFKIHLIKLKIGTLFDKYDPDTSFFNQNHMNIIIHGCMIIFTESFFKKLDGFNPKTFLYKEEELLYIMVRMNHLKTLYCTDIYITHLEDVATNSIIKGNREKRDFVYSNQINSLNILIEELSNEKCQ